MAISNKALDAFNCWKGFSGSGNSGRTVHNWINTVSPQTVSLFHSAIDEAGIAASLLNLLARVWNFGCISGEGYGCQSQCHEARQSFYHNVFLLC